MWLTIFVILVLATFVVRLFFFQVVNASDINKESESAMMVNHSIKAVRGEIEDSNGSILASTILSWDVNIDPVNVRPVVLKIDGQDVSFSKEQIAQKLSDLLNVSVEDIFERMSGSVSYTH